MKNLVIGIFIGVILGILLYPYIPLEQAPIEIEYPNDFSKVKKVDGILVYINSTPVNIEKFQKIDEFDPALIEDAINNLVSNFGINKIKQTIRSLSFDNKLRKTLEIVKSRHQEVDAIVLDDGFNYCTVYTIN